MKLNSTFLVQSIINIVLAMSELKLNYLVTLQQFVTCSAINKLNYHSLPKIQKHIK